jgi:hypothetical protein
MDDYHECPNCTGLIVINKNDFIFGCGSPLQYKDNKLIICDYI